MKPRGEPRNMCAVCVVYLLRSIPTRTRIAMQLPDALSVVGCFVRYWVEHMTGKIVPVAPAKFQHAHTKKKHKAQKALST